LHGKGSKIGELGFFLKPGFLLSNMADLFLTSLLIPSYGLNTILKNLKDE